MFRRLDPGHLLETANRLSRRVDERFPGSGLGAVVRELIQVGEAAAREHPWFARPHVGLRILVGLCIGLLVLVTIALVAMLIRLPAASSLTEIVPTIEAGINEIVFVGVAIYFLLGLEVRRKRRRALQALHELRSMAHIIDMHQLTKDPERVRMGDDATDTPSSPSRTLSVFELARYLDYCSESLSLLSKFAVLYIQDFDDPVTISAVNEIEDLTNGLSRKIWQKIMILDQANP